jgi:hypothetical protein
MDRDMAFVVLLAALLFFGTGFFVLLSQHSTDLTNQPQETPAPASFYDSTLPPTPTFQPTPTPTPPPAVYTPPPSIPEYTLQLNDYSYDVPQTVTTTVNPFNGKEEQTVHYGFHVDNRSISIEFQNQPFSPQTLPDGNVTGFYYFIRVKGHFSSDDWYTFPFIEAYDGSYTRQEYFLGENSQIYMFRALASGDQLDFQVQAKIGYGTFVPDPLRSGFYHEGYVAFTTVKESGWSATQTLTIP